MKRQFNNQLLALSACILLPFSSPVSADEAAEAPDTSNWVCRFCPVSGGWFGQLDFGLLYADDPTLKFADYRGLDDDGGYLDAGGTISYRDDDGIYFDFYGRNLGLDSRALEMRGGKQGKFELRASYSEIPRYQGHGTQSPFIGVGSDTLLLLPSWEGYGDEQSLKPVSLDSKRKTSGAGFEVKLGSSWKYEADFERQTRDGTRSFNTGLFAISAAFIPAPVDFTTDVFTTGLEFSGDSAQFRLGFTSSDFDNGKSSVTWDNPLALGFGDELVVSALEPDNEYYQFSLAGAVRFSNRFRVSGKASVGKAEQDELFLPYSTNPRYADLELPRSSLNGKLETSMYNFSGRAYLRLANRLDLLAQYKVSERDNKTPVDVYTPILLDVLQSSPRSNRPYGYERDTATLELRYRPTYNLRLNAGAKQDELERTYQSVRKTEEDTYWGEVQFSPWAWISARLKVDQSDRSTTPYEQIGNFERAENPLMRKFNMAERDRDRSTFEIDLSPTDKLGVNLSYYTTEDDYEASEIGLRSGEEESFSLDLNYAFNKTTSLYVFFTEDEIESEMSAAEEFDAVPWDAFTEDEVQTWGLGLSGQFNEKLSYGFDYVSSESEGEILTDSGLGEEPFPVLETDLTNTRVYLSYQINDKWSLGLDAYREEYETSDWLIDGLGPYDIRAVMTMGETSPDYEVNVYRLLTTYRF